MVNQKLYGLLILSFLLNLSCKEKKVTDDVIGIERSQMINILVDMYVADSAVSNVAAEQRDSVRRVYRLYIEKIHNTPMEKIDSLVQNLTNYPSLNKEIQKEVVDSIKAIEAIK